MSAELKPHLRLEIAHVLFVDIVGYSKLLIDEQKELLQELNDIVRKTDQVREAEAEGKLVRLPTGDGMAMAFSNHPEAPVECALEISKALQSHPEIKLRMGIHSGAVNPIADVNDRSNVAGAGINIAQRVMDCGDAGHILLSKHVADDLAQYRRWQPHLHDLGEVEVKHGNRLHIFNLYTDELGNRAVPEKFNAVSVAAAARHAEAERRRVTAATPRSTSKPAVPMWAWIGGALLIFAAIAFGFLILRSKDSLTATTAATAIPAKSIAVLPFDNLSDDKQNAYFTDGVQDEILTDLAKIADLKVISRSSVMQYKSGVARNLRKIGEELGVARLLEGSVQRAANRVRVNAQLIDARNDAHLWAQTYDRDLADVFAIQSEIAKAIADQLQAKLSPNEKAAIEKPPTTDVTAFDLYSRAKTLSYSTSFTAAQGQNLLQAADLLNQAVARDPAFFQAYCLLAYTHGQLYFLGIDHTPARLALAESAVDAAFRLQPDAGEAHLARAQNLYRGHLDYDGALHELEISRRTLPNDPRIFELTGYIRRRQGHQQDGLRNLERSLELDPRNFFTLQQIALSYYNMRRYSDVAAVLDRALAIKPDDADTQVTRGLVELDWKADTRPLHETIDSIRANSPAKLPSVADTWLIGALAERNPVAVEAALVALGDGVFGNDAMQAFHRSFGEGVLARMSKDEGKARSVFTAARAQQEKVVQDQPNYGPALCVLGLIDAALGRKEEALREGRRAIELLPITKDSLNGARVLESFAIIAVWVGEKDLACEQLATVTRLTGYGTVSYGQLKLMPYWDPLRGDPRFEKIVAALAPKN